jgi:sigma-E factor negative regulatory protein RseA
MPDGGAADLFDLVGHAMDTQKRLHENISALADGELPDSERELALAALGTVEGQAAWRAYHLTGDVLRGTPGGELSAGFDAALAARLAAEPPYAAATGESAGAGDSDAAAASGAATADAQRQDQAESPADVILP